MKLLTKAILNSFPEWHSLRKPNEVVKVIVKFFCPWNDWAWYAVEFDGEDTFFGFVHGDFPEFGYFSLSEMESVTGPLGLKIERDMHFGNHTLKEVMKRSAEGRRL